jgi:hypothetical protein
MKTGANITADSPVRNKRSLQSCRSGCRTGGLDGRQITLPTYPAKHNRLSLLVKIRYLSQDLSCDGMIRRVTKAFKKSGDMLSWLAVDEQDSSVYSIHFGSEDAVKTAETIAE